MRASKFASVLSAVVLLSGCASIIDGPTQNVRIETPGATEAECTLTNGVKYRAVSGETLRIMRSHRDLVVDCYASGNRRQQVVVQSTFNAWGAANVTNGAVPGGTYDHLSGGLYIYPDVITVDFVGIPTRGFETPDYMNKDLPNPYRQSIESYGASTPAIPQDSEYLKRGIKKRDADLSTNPFATGGGADMSEMPAPATADVPAMTPSKPNLSGSSAEELTRSANPDVFDK